MAKYNYDISTDVSGSNIYKKYTTASGKTYTLDTGGSDDYKYNNLFRRGTGKQLDAYIQYYIKYGKEPSQYELNLITGQNVSDGAYRNLRRDFDTFLSKNDADIDSFRYDIGVSQDNLNADAEQSAQEAAFNEYYRDIYSTEVGTTGGDIYNRMVEAERNAARSNMTLADAQMQQAAMQQASTVKALTDQVKAERMAKLRAGMSEAQIANQDMQMMMTNINALNQQANEMNYAQLQAQQQYNLAQDTAYQQWLDNANVMGQTGAAYAASDAGDVYQQALRIQQRTGMSFAKALEQAQGRNQ